MKPGKARTDIQNLLDLLLRSDVLIYSNPVVKMQKKAGETRVTWGNATSSTSGELFRGSFATLEDYCKWLEAGAYSAILYDGSILQFSYDFEGEQLTGHRLAYYPCPFDVDRELLRVEPLLDLVELYREHEPLSMRLRSPLRFDYDLENHSENHPAAHLTLLWSCCRWALATPLSPGHFVRFLFKHFYPDQWTSLKFIRDWPQHSGDRTITAEEENILHVSCGR